MTLATTINLTREKLIKRIAHYGFIECGCMLAFLECVCQQTLDRAAYRFIYDKVKECLGNHYDNRHRDYFQDLLRLQSEIEYILSVNV